jgi:hypothetical protein
MANPNLLPHCNMWGKPTGTVVSINSITKDKVIGHLQYSGGIAIPFEVFHDYVSFQIGGDGPRFYFKDWKKLS